MSETTELKLYSPIQVDIIDRDRKPEKLDTVIPLQAVDREHERDYLSKIMRAFRELQPQEDARGAFTVPEQDWSEVSEKMVSLTRAVEQIRAKIYGVYTCRSSDTLNPEEIDAVKRHCRDQWEQGWGEGYAHCPREGPSLGLYIHFWQDDLAPLLTREELAAMRNAEQSKSSVAEITPDTFWSLIAQAKDLCGQRQEETVYWLTEQLLALGPEQALNFHSIMHGYIELSDKFGLWNAAALILENGCFIDGFMDFRAWLIAQGKDVYLAALKDPDSLADVSVGKNCRFSAFLYASDMAYERLTGRMAHNDVEPDRHQQLLAELRRDIVYGEGIDYPHEWSEVRAYLPCLTAQHLTKQELQACVGRGRLWNHDDPEIKRARAAVPKKKKLRQIKGGDAR